MDFPRSATDSIHDVRAGLTTPAALLAEALERIEAIDTTGYELNSILAIAQQSGEARFDINSPLAGLPIVIKDNIEAVGLPGTAGSTALLDHMVVQDSLLTMRLRAAGAPIGTVPMGICEGLPVGLGVVAALHGELLLVSALAQIERALDLGVLAPTFKK